MWIRLSDQRLAARGTSHYASCLTGTEAWKGVNIYMLWNSVYPMMAALVARLRAEEGQTMAEYGLLLAVIAVVVVAAAIVLGSDISSLFVKVANDL